MDKFYKHSPYNQAHDKGNYSDSSFSHNTGDLGL